jgi:hypothetical protein
VNIVIHTASSLDPTLALNLLAGLGSSYAKHGIHIDRALTSS